MRKRAIMMTILAVGVLACTALSIGPALSARPKQRSLLIQQFRETPGSTAQFGNCTDTEIHCTYFRGLPGTRGTKRSASVKLYLYDQATGLPMLSSTGLAVANPHTVQLGSDPAERKAVIKIEDLIVAKGGFTASPVLGFAVMVVAGADPDGVNIQGVVVNSHTGPFDLSVFGFDPVPISAAP